MTDQNRSALMSEGLGTLLLVATVVGSGIMAERLAGGNVAIALLGNTIPTGAILVVLISIFGPISGAHFNPIVSAVMAHNGSISWNTARNYAGVQIIGGIVGALLANAMFELPIFELSTKLRSGLGQCIAETVASFGLILTIFGGIKNAPQSVAMLVGLYITAAYWFTSSTSFANPAVTIARMFSDSFAGIAPQSVLPFIVAQAVGGVAGYIAAKHLFT